MGGAPAGDVASAAAVQAFRPLDDTTPQDVREALAGAVRAANAEVASIIAADPRLDGMGTTVTAILFDGEQMALAHLGDSRGYLLRDGELTQLTHDHTLVQGLVDAGRLTEEAARYHPHRSMILRVVDGGQDSEADITLLDPRPGDRLLLCSDGLSGVVEDAEIAAVMSDGTPDWVAVELTQRALEGGGPDNITCVVADVVEDIGDLSPNASRMLLVGAAAEQPRSPLGDPHSAPRADTGELPAVTDEVDPEELRYAPRPPRRFRWLRRLVVVAVVLGLLYAGGRVAYDWSQRQYYVGAFGETVAIYRGVRADLPGIDLSNVYAAADDVALTALPEYARERVNGGIESNSLSDAEATVEELRTLAEQCAAAALADAGSGETTRGKNASPTPTPTSARGASPCAGVDAGAVR
jgi:PPM family protein phosphatase